MSAPKTVSAAEFQNNFGRYADAAREGPVVVTRYGREELVVLCRCGVRTDARLISPRNRSR